MTLYRGNPASPQEAKDVEKDWASPGLTTIASVRIQDYGTPDAAGSAQSALIQAVMAGTGSYGTDYKNPVRESRLVPGVGQVTVLTVFETKGPRKSTDVLFTSGRYAVTVIGSQLANPDGSLVSPVVDPGHPSMNFYESPTIA